MHWIGKLALTFLHMALHFSFNHFYLYLFLSVIIYISLLKISTYHMILSSDAISFTAGCIHVQLRMVDPAVFIYFAVTSILNFHSPILAQYGDRYSVKTFLLFPV